MQLLFKQRIFSWFDSYDVYDENNVAVFTVQGRLAWGHCLEISDPAGNYVGTVKEEVLTLLPRFALYIGENCIGELTREFSLFHPSYHLDCNGWEIEGDLFGWDYTVTDGSGREIMRASKQLFNFSDVYVLDINDPNDALLCLMTVLAIDAANCSANNG